MISRESFVVTWQNAESLDEVCETLDIKPGSAQTKASQFRKKGIPLKRFAGARRGPKPVDWGALRALAVQHSPTGE